METLFAIARTLVGIIIVMASFVLFAVVYFLLAWYVAPLIVGERNVICFLVPMVMLTQVPIFLMFFASCWPDVLAGLFFGLLLAICTIPFSGFIFLIALGYLLSGMDHLPLAKPSH